MTEISDLKHRALPAPTLETEPYWDALKQHRLVIPRCRACGGCWQDRDRAWAGWAGEAGAVKYW